MIRRMRGFLRALLVTAAGWGLSLGCSDDSERPEGLDPCAGDGEGCVTPGQTGEASGGGSAVDAGTADGSTEGGGETAISGVVLEYADDQFLLASQYAGEAEVFTDGPDGNTVTADYDGVNAFTLEGALATEWGWMGVQPWDSTSDWLPTLHPVDTTAGAAVELPLVRASVIELVLQVGTSPLAREAAAAQLVLRFVDETGLALPGISIETSDPTQPILFRDGSTWSDTDTVTLADGLVLVPNLPAFELPGGTIPVTFSDGVDSYVLQPRVAQGTVTVMTVLVAA